MGEDSADLIAVKVPGVPSQAIRQGAPVKVTGLVAQPWTMADRSGGVVQGRGGRASHNPSQGQLTNEGRDATPHPGDDGGAGRPAVGSRAGPSTTRTSVREHPGLCIRSGAHDATRPYCPCPISGRPG
jgi:hypothetical protein